MIEYSDKGKKDEIVKKILNSPILNKKDGYTKHVLNYIEKFGYTIFNNIDNTSSDNSNSNSNSNQKDNMLNVNKNVNKVINTNNLNSFLNNNINIININENSDSDSSYFKDEDYEDLKIENEKDDVNDEIMKKDNNVNINNFYK